MLNLLNRKSTTAFVKNILAVFNDGKMHSPFLFLPGANKKFSIDVGYRLHRLQEVLNEFPFQFHDLSATEKEKLIQGTLYKKWMHEKSGYLVPNPYEELTQLLFRHHVLDSHSELIEWNKVLQPQLSGMLSEEKDVNFLINHNFLSLWTNYHTIEGITPTAVEALTQFPEQIDYECNNKNTVFHGFIKKCYGQKHIDLLTLDFFGWQHKRLEPEVNENDITERVQALLNTKPNVNTQNNQGDTPLTSLLKNVHNYEHSSFSKIVQSLISAGADVTHQNAAGLTPVQYIVPVLIHTERRVNQFMRSENYWIPEFRRCFNTINNTIYENLVHITRALINAGADLNIKYEKGFEKGSTPLMLFIQQERHEKTLDEPLREILSSFLNKADLTLTNAAGETPLLMALNGQNKEITQSLLEAGANLNDVLTHQQKLYEKRFNTFKNNVIQDVNLTLKHLPVEYQQAFMKKLNAASDHHMSKLIASQRAELKLKDKERTREN